MRFIYSVIFMPDVDAKKAELKAHGIKDPINFYKMYRQDAPWITMDTEGVSIPVDFVPPNVTRAGPIVLSGAPAEEQDPKLVAWMRKAPTLLINLGSSVHWSETQATVMSQAVANVMREQPGLQILWKFKKWGNYSDEEVLRKPLGEYLDSGRLRMERWLPVDPTSLLESGLMVASVHHGGSNCFHEAIA